MYEVGDRVDIISNDPGASKFRGLQGTVEKAKGLEGGRYYIVRFDPGQYPRIFLFFEDELHPHEETNEEVSEV